MVAPVALSTGEAILLIAIVAVPLALISFALGARGALRQVGAGPLSIERHTPSPGDQGSGSAREREDEIRQMLEAKAYRQQARGEQPLDVDAELAAALDEGSERRADPQLVTEVRQLVVAHNERRARRGERPLDVEAEVERRLAELEALDQ